MQPKHFIGFLLLLPLTIGLAEAQPRRPATATPSRSDQLEAFSRPSLTMRARVYTDSVVLRWVVNPGAYWLQANQRGYILERLTYASPGAAPTRQVIGPQPIRPWSLDSMKRLLPRNDPYVAAAAQLLHGKTYQNLGSSEMAAFYKQYEEQQGKLLVATMAAEFSPAAASALALRWVDRTYPKNTYRLVYRLRINNGPSPKPIDLTDVATAEVFPNRIDTLTAPVVERVVPGERALTLSWYNYHQQGNYAGYFIERSNDGKTFQRVNKSPFVYARPDSASLAGSANRSQTRSDTDIRLVEYTDSVPTNYRRYYYRIVGINSFGDLSPASATLVGSAVDLTPPPAPVNLQRQVQNNQRVVLTWDVTQSTPDLRGFVVGRSESVKGPFTPVTSSVLPVSARTFTDEKPGVYFGQYYVIAAVDTAGNMAYSLPIVAVIEDHTPPAAPHKPTARVDTNGVVQLQWAANREVDVVGYRVYRSYQLDNPLYAQRTSFVLPDTMLVDTLPTRTLTRKAYYKLAAVDAAGNASAFSEPIEVLIPDKIPPATPVISDVAVENRGIRLTLTPSRSDDVVEHTLYRREPGGLWLPISRFAGSPVGTITLIDTVLVHQKTYEYSLIARDRGGRQSERSFVVSAQYVNLQKLGTPPPTDLQAVYDTQQKGIRLGWKSAALAGSQRFIIYRGINGEPPTMYRAVDQTNVFLDQNLSTTGMYTYAVQLVMPDRKSVPSQSVQITYKP